ncbi:MAG TPA: 50S ribosomal protein L31 [Candidatus Rubneribacter avistercoris]|nr:50S ribosomal protein L31 [Candidatus Rubneribacter avistercoris]
MKQGIHPEYMECTVKCSCGNTFTTRSTKPELKIDICNVCHPFYTGQQRFVDTGGRVQRFADKFGAAKETVAEREAAKKAARAAAAAEREAAKKAEREAKAAEKAKRAEEFAKKAAEAEAKKAAEQAAVEEGTEMEVSGEEAASVDALIEEAQEAAEAPAAE